jgi:hypothetical protein
MHHSTGATGRPPHGTAHARAGGPVLRRVQTTLARSTKARRLSATRREGGGYAIDLVELCRVYLPRATPATVTLSSDATPPVTPHDSEIIARLATLEAEVRGLRELLAEVRESRDEAKASLDVERDRLRMVMAALPKPADPAPQDAPQPATAGRWRRFWLPR